MKLSITKTFDKEVADFFLLWVTTVYVNILCIFRLILVNMKEVKIILPMPDFREVQGPQKNIRSCI